MKNSWYRNEIISTGLKLLKGKFEQVLIAVVAWLPRNLPLCYVFDVIPRIISWMYLHQLHNTAYVSSPLYKRVLFIQTESEAAIENASKDEA